MKQKIFIFIFIIFTLNQCTGFHAQTLLQGTQNTNPTPAYANYYQMVYKGGFIFHNDTVGGQIGNSASSKLVGEACQLSILYLVSWGNSSISEAKKIGKIKRVATIEYEQFGLFAVLYHSFCTKVTGDDVVPASSNEPEMKVVAPENVDAKAVKLPAKKGK